MHWVYRIQWPNLHWWVDGWASIHWVGWQPKSLEPTNRTRLWWTNKLSTFLWVCTVLTFNLQLYNSTECLPDLFNNPEFWGINLCIGKWGCHLHHIHLHTPYTPMRNKMTLDVPVHRVFFGESCWHRFRILPLTCPKPSFDGQFYDHASNDWCWRVWIVKVLYTVPVGYHKPIRWCALGSSPSASKYAKLYYKTSCLSLQDG